MRGEWCAAAVAAAGLLTACTTPAPSTSAKASSACTEGIAAIPEPSEGYRIVDGDVAVVDAEVLRPDDNQGGAGPTAKFAKWALLIRAGASAELSVASGWEERARIGWGVPAEPVTRFTVTACPAADGVSAWSVFPGGTWVSAPACVPLVIATGGHRTQVGIPVGARCAA